MIVLNLPWPPSVNTYWRHVGSQTLISKPGRKYRKRVLDSLALNPVSRSKLSDRLSVVLVCHAPDNRRRDLDNLPKGLLDALTKAGIWEDDSQIDDLRIIRGKSEKPGRVCVEIQAMQQQDA